MKLTKSKELIEEELKTEVESKEKELNVITKQIVSLEKHIETLKYKCKGSEQISEEQKETIQWQDAMIGSLEMEVKRLEASNKEKIEHEKKPEQHNHLRAKLTKENKCKSAKARLDFLSTDTTISANIPPPPLIYDGNELRHIL
jgi:hypothetical protein